MRHQTENPTWKDQRIGRITGSVAHDACDVLTKTRKIMQHVEKTDTSNLVAMLMGERTVNPNIYALKYGRTIVM